jgi:hypothetical protein
VSESAELLRLLRRIRRRARGLAALEGAVAGAALGIGALALGAVAWRARGAHLPWRLATPVGLAAAAVGAALAAARAIPLDRCARLLDAAIDRGGRAGDRVLSALSFASGGGPLARAAVADAVSRARAYAPAFVAPARRPRGLAALLGAAAALAVVGAWPARAPGARRGDDRPAAAEALEPRLRVDARSLDAERAEIIAAATAADEAGDVRLRALAREARATLDALTDGALGRGEALDRLTALAARAREAADEAAAEQAALRAAGKALEPTASTRALGRALGADDPRGAERALSDLAARAAATETARAEIARALGAAAAGVGDAAGDADASRPGEGRRRLDRDDPAGGSAPSAGGGATAASSERRLEHLRRDLEGAAAGCRGSAEECANRLRDGGGELSRAAREAAETPARRRLESAVRQLRERLRRGELEGGASERRFGRVARGDARSGERDAQGAERRAGQREGAEGRESAEGAEGEAAGEGEGGDEIFSDAPGDEGGGATGEAAASSGAGAGAMAGGARGAGDGEGAPAGGSGAGREAGGDPLGRGSMSATRGHAREVSVRNGAGPTRSEVIEASARRGFAAREYVRVFGDYAPVVEESLASGAVPEGRRYVVRRYFQLIRPRAPAPRAP